MHPRCQCVYRQQVVYVWTPSMCLENQIEKKNHRQEMHFQQFKGSLFMNRNLCESIAQKWNSLCGTAGAQACASKLFYVFGKCSGWKIGFKSVSNELLNLSSQPFGLLLIKIFSNKRSFIRLMAIPTIYTGIIKFCFWRFGMYTFAFITIFRKNLSTVLLQVTSVLDEISTPYNITSFIYAMIFVAIYISIS